MLDRRISSRYKWAMETTIIARLGRHKSRPERLALISPTGKPLNWFALDETREHLAAVLAKAGMTLRDDDTVVRADAA